MTLSLDIPWFGFLALLALAAVAVWAYRGTTPSVSGGMRGLLTTLRMSAFVLLVVLFADPRCVREVTRTEPARVIALLDHSASMSLPNAPGGTETRFEAATEVMDRLRRQVSRRGGELEAGLFSSQVSFAALDTARANAQGTDVAGSIAEALRRFEGENVTAVVVLSDGVDTEATLVRSATPDIPVFAIGFGDTTAPEDVRVSAVDYNSVVRAPAQSQISAAIAYSGNRTKQVTIQLMDGNRTVFSKDTTMSPGVSTVNLDIPVRFPTPGRREFDLSVSVVGDDAEPSNNSREIVIDAEKAQAKLVLVDLAPDWELHFLTQLLESDPTYTFELFGPRVRPAASVGKLRPLEEFRASLNDADAVVVRAIDGNFMSSDNVTALKNFVRERGGGLLLLPGPSSVYESAAAWSGLQEVLPLSGSAPFRFNLRYTSVLPGAQAGTNPVTAQLVPLLNQTDWQERSPLLGYYGAVRTSQASQVLLSVRGGSLPAVAYATPGKGRVAAITVGPLWRWKFLADNVTVYDEMLSRLIDVLARGEETDRFVLTSRKNVFDAGESPELVAEIFNEKMQPVTGVPVRVEVSSVDAVGNETPLRQTTMSRESAQNTRFMASLPPLPSGRYRVRGSAELSDRTIASKAVDIQVSTTSVEFQRVNQDAQALGELARRSGGQYAPVAGLASVVESMPLASREVGAQTEVVWRTSAWLFLLVLGLLTAEWLIRKRVGMI